jgi:hypothetical protein
MGENSANGGAIDRKVVYIGAVIVFISMFFIFFTFDNVSRINSACMQAACDRTSQMASIMFGLIISGIFMATAVQVSKIMLVQSGYKEDGSENRYAEIKIASLQKEYDKLLKAMQITKENYEKGRIKSDTLDVLVNGYKTKMFRIKAEIKELEKKLR